MDVRIAYTPDDVREYCLTVLGETEEQYRHWSANTAAVHYVASGEPFKCWRHRDKAMPHFWRDVLGYFTFQDFYRWVAKQMPGNAHMVEVGSYAGQSAAFLAVELVNQRDACRPCAKYTLDLVDWFQQVPVEQVCKNLAPLADKGIIGELVRSFSHVAAEKYADASLDFVFIDAGHDYADVAKDIDAWLPKVKPGGIIAGHDFCNEFPGVIQAVTERFAKWEVWRGDAWSTDAPMVGKFYPVWCVRVP